MSAGTAVANQCDEWETDDLKRLFAKALLFNPKDTYKVAKEIVLGNPGKALIMSERWPTDPIVISEQRELIKQHGELYFLPTKAQIARKAYEEAETGKTTSDRLSAMKLYCSIMGFTEEGRATITNNISNNNTTGDNKVMVVVSHGNNEEWENRAKSQQAELVAIAQEDIQKDIENMISEEDNVWTYETKRA